MLILEGSEIGTHLSQHVFDDQKMLVLRVTGIGDHGGGRQVADLINLIHHLKGGGGCAHPE